MTDEVARIEKAYEPTFVTVRGAAERAGCTPQTINNWIRNEGLPFKRIRRAPGSAGRLFPKMIDIDDLDDFTAKKYAKK
jgi:hypothetical protein